MRGCRYGRYRRRNWLGGRCGRRCCWRRDRCGRGLWRNRCCDRCFGWTRRHGRCRRPCYGRWCWGAERLLRCWCGRWNIAKDIMDGSNNIFNTDLGLYEIAIGAELFTAEALIF